MKDEKVLSIDVEGVLRERLPRLCRFIPSGVFRWLERTICQEQLNGLLAANAGKEGAEFCRGVFDTLGVDYTVSHPCTVISAARYGSWSMTCLCTSRRSTLCSSR